eukprot:8142377-Karenia_brevis.AAC.1
MRPGGTETQCLAAVDQYGFDERQGPPVYIPGLREKVEASPSEPSRPWTRAIFKFWDWATSPGTSRGHLEAQEVDTGGIAGSKSEQWLSNGMDILSVGLPMTASREEKGVRLEADDTLSIISEAARWIARASISGNGMSRWRWKVQKLETETGP